MNTTNSTTDKGALADANSPVSPDKTTPAVASLATFYVEVQKDYRSRRDADDQRTVYGIIGVRAESEAAARARLALAMRPSVEGDCLSTVDPRIDWEEPSGMRDAEYVEYTFYTTGTVYGVKPNVRVAGWNATPSLPMGSRAKQNKKIPGKNGQRAYLFAVSGRFPDGGASVIEGRDTGRDGIFQWAQDRAAEFPTSADATEFFARWEACGFDWQHADLGPGVRTR